MAAVPLEVVELVTNLDERLQRLETHIHTILDAWSPEAIACLSATERASAYMAVSKALNAVYCLYLKTHGEAPENHPVKSELERASLFAEKVQYACDRSRAPRPTMSLNMQAATRFIEHAIPDLSQEQKELVREAGKAKREIVEGSNKRQKTFESIGEAADAFLTEASKEVFGDQNL